MSFTIPCERCQRVGLVRVERIITGKITTLSYFCGGCDHTWQIVQPEPRKNPPVALRPRKDRRHSA